MALMFGGLFLLCINSIQAATYTVSNTNDSGAGSLRQAITDANANAGADAITFTIDNDSTIIVSSLLPVITGRTIIDASNKTGITVTQAGSLAYGFRFNANADASRLSGLTIANFKDQAVLIISGAQNITIGVNCGGAPDSQQANIFINNGSGESTDAAVNIEGNSNYFYGNYVGTNSGGATIENKPHGVIVQSDYNYIGYNENHNCTTAQARNYFYSASSDSVTYTGLYVYNSSGEALGNRVMGNYFGTVDGSTSLGRQDYAIYSGAGATSNWIGTNGNNTDDDSEGNYFIDYKNSIYLKGTGSSARAYGNRIAGNTFQGVGTNHERGIWFDNYSVENIVGFCEATDDDDFSIAMCDNSGTVANQRNYFLGMDYSNSSAGIYLAKNTSSSNKIWGNYFGVGTGNGNTSGIRLGESLGNRIGQVDEKANTFQNNTYGIWGIIVPDDASLKSTGNVIRNNTFSENTSHGIFLQNMAYLQDDDNDGPIIRNNTIYSNGGSGISIVGTSPIVFNNTIYSNSVYGIYITSSGDDPDNYTSDLEAAPQIGGSGVENIIYGNSLGGIYVVDAAATQLSDNNIGNNNSLFDIKISRRLAVEIMDKNNDPYTSGTFAVKIENNDGSTQMSGRVYTDNSVWGYDNFDYNDTTTWPEVVEYEYDANGNLLQYSPLTIKISGDYENDQGSSYSLDSQENCLITSNLCRYRTPEVQVSTIPSQPSNYLPASGVTNVSVYPTLRSSSFQDTTENPGFSHWRIFPDSACISSNVTHSSGEVGDISFYTMTTPLEFNTQYWWNVVHQNEFGNYSTASTCTSFITAASVIVSSNISDISFNEDNTSTINLNNYFTNIFENEMSYSASEDDSPTHISISVNDQGRATLTPDENWNGSETMTIVATDTQGYSSASNQVTITVNAVNDAPNQITSKFSPTNKATISSATPTLSFAKATDVDDDQTDLTYIAQISTNNNFFDYESYNSNTGSNKIKITQSLENQTTYYWRVRAKDDDKDKGEWSDTKQFYVDTEEIPNLSLTKTITIGTAPFSLINSFIKIVNADTFDGVEVEFKEASTSVYQVPLWLLFTLFLLSFIFTLRYIKKPSHIFHLVFKSPNKSFVRLADRNKKGTYKIGYNAYKKNVRVNHFSFISLGITIIAIISVIQLTPALKASDQNGTAVEPGNYLLYKNIISNDGDAEITDITLNDSLPTCTTLVADSISFSDLNGEVEISGRDIEFNIANIAASTQGFVSYAVQIDNPCTENISSISTQGTVASFSNTTSESNALSNPLEISSFKLTISNTSGVVVSGATATLTLDGQLITSTTSDSSGLVEFTGLGSGTYYLTVSGTNYQGYASYVTLERNGASEQSISIIPVVSDDSSSTPEPEEETSDDYITVEIDDLEYIIPTNLQPPTTDLEKQELKDQMELFLKLLQVNDQTVADQESFEATISDIEGVEEYYDEQGNLKTIINISGPELVLKGITLPNAKVTITLRSDPIIKVAQADENGKWELKIPMELIAPGEHVVYAQSELYGVATDEIVLGKISVPERQNRISKTLWLIMGNLIFLASLIVFVLIYTKRKKVLAFKKLKKS